jgi:hypothetical protein
LETWSSLGVETVICGMGSVPFHVGSLDDVELMGETLRNLTGNPRG